MVYILFNVHSRELHATVFVSEASALAKQAELGVSWVLIERELEAVAPAEQPAPEPEPAPVPEEE
jgi:hypothetical protein